MSRSADVSPDESSRGRPLVVGLLGGVASGKSYVAQEFAQLGAGILDADRVGHEVLREPEVVAALRARWGDRVFHEDGTPDRRAIAEIVFAPSPDGPPELAFLEGLTHPRIGQRLLELAESFFGSGKPVVVLDAAMMLKAGWDRFCDCLIFVDAPKNVRLARALQRGWTEEEFAAREAAQESLPEKQAAAQDTIDNSGDSESTRRQVAAWWRARVG